MEASPLEESACGGYEIIFSFVKEIHINALQISIGPDVAVLFRRK